MASWLSTLFDTSDFPARWHCGMWTSTHGWVHIASDLAIFGAYFAIPLSILFFVIKRRDVPFPPIFWLFAVFIFSCGFGHLIEATIFWHPWYRFDALVKVVTALASWATVVAVIRVMPQAVALPGLARLNQQLESEINERRAAEDRMRASLTEKETLLQEIHHRVKNNLQMVSSMVSLQTSHTHSDETRAILTQFQQRIHSMAILHERLYQSENLSAIRLDHYLEQIAAALSDSYIGPARRVRVVVRSDPVVGPIATALPLGLIVNELVSNSLKHGYPEGRAGSVTVRLASTGGGKVLDVIDDGIGAEPGFNPGKKQTLGLRLVHIMASQLRGTVDWSYTSGFHVTVRIPDEPPVQSVQTAADETGAGI